MFTFYGKRNKVIIILLAILLVSSLLTSYFLTKSNWHASASNRIGFGLSTKADPKFWAEKLHASWYLDWKTSAIPSGQAPEYWQMIRLSASGYTPSANEIKALTVNFPGHVWIIGNEPDNIWQDNIPAKEFAQYYHEIYALIKNFDPTAKIAVGAISQPTQLRLSYLNQVLNEYKQQYHQSLPADWWTLHAYVLREEVDSWGAGIPPGMTQKRGDLYMIEDHSNLSIFKENVIQFRKWMNNNGYQNKPLAITEFGILLPAEFGSTPSLVSDYLKETFLWLESATDSEIGYPADNDRLVQKFAWFSLADINFPVADLAELSTNSLTSTGETFFKTALSLDEE
ncbi:MAG: hypothetical protein BGO78_00350 [Chloroflexi bacterium 44-23]|nr:MAG: hypothetical protein BGO78_00350 [Chloroflexi bacterium 44-23]